MNVPALLNTLTSRSRTLPIVILYVTEGCNLQCGMCSYRDPLPGELTLDELKTLSKELFRNGLKHIVYSGGEPLTRRDFLEICNLFQQSGVKQTLLTNGLLLMKRLPELQNYFHEIIVSLDGCSAETHNTIRGVNSFDTIIEGIQQAVSGAYAGRVSLRTVIQKKNYKEIGGLVDLAKSLGISRVSFLAVDIDPSSFGRQNGVNTASAQDSMLNQTEVQEFESIIKEIFATHRNDFESKFISESPGKMMHIVQYFRALLENDSFPRNRCNAPMVSTVITSTGNVAPCFFLPTVGNIRNDAFASLLNNQEMVTSRTNVRNYSLDRCHTCVCTLHVSPMQALVDNF